MKRVWTNRSGTTLIESMIVVAVFLFIMSGIFLSVYVGQQNFQANSVQMRMNAELRKAMSSLIYDLRQAGQSSIVDVPADDSSYEIITFKIPEDVTGGAVDWEDDFIEYALGGENGNQLQKTVGDEVKTVAANISNLAFVRRADSPGIIEVSLTAQQQTAKGETVNSGMDFEIKLRN